MRRPASGPHASVGAGVLPLEALVAGPRVRGQPHHDAAVSARLSTVRQEGCEPCARSTRTTTARMLHPKTGRRFIGMNPPLAVLTALELLATSPHAMACQWFGTQLERDLGASRLMIGTQAAGQPTYVRPFRPRRSRTTHSSIGARHASARWSSSCRTSVRTLACVGRSETRRTATDWWRPVLQAS